MCRCHDQVIIAFGDLAADLRIGRTLTQAQGAVDATVPQETAHNVHLAT
jgi:hypothetical protein